MQFALLIIGNEILQAVVQEENLYYAARQLSSIGYSIDEVRIVRDDVQGIARALQDLVVQYPYVITSGGVGPTHDDMSMAAVAEGMKRKLAEHPEMLQFLMNRYHPPTAAQLIAIQKMSRLPEGCQVHIKNNSWPLFQVDDVFIMPGLPVAFRSKIDYLIERLPRLESQWVAEIMAGVGETEFADILTKCQEQCPNASIGSYPVVEQKYRAYVRIVGNERELVEQAFQMVYAIFQEQNWATGVREPQQIKA